MAYIVAVGAIPFHKYPQKSFSDLVCDTLNSVQNDISSHETILSKDTEEIFFGNCAMDRFGQSNIRGQVALQKSVDEGLLPQGIPITNIEAGCATGGVTLVQAWRSIKSGSCEVALAIGVEKLHFQDERPPLRFLPSPNCFARRRRVSASRCGGNRRGLSQQPGSLGAWGHGGA